MTQISASAHALLQTYPQATKLYLGVEQGVTLLTARADGGHVEGDTTILLKNVVVDDLNNLMKGMTVALHGTAANNRRVDAVFLDYNPTTKILTLGPNARQVDNDFYVTVYSSMKLWRLAEPTYPGAQQYPPFAIIGPPRAGFVNEELKFIGNQSYSAVGRNLAAYTWRRYQANHLGGHLNAANTPTSPLRLSWDAAGEYLVRLRVVDSQGEIGTTMRPVLMFDRTGANAPYDDVKIKSCRWNNVGWTAEIVVTGVGDRVEFPPQALIVLFAEDWYGETKQSVGGCMEGVNEIIFAGWIRDGTTHVNANTQTVTFIADSVERAMQTLSMPGFTFRDAAYNPEGAGVPTPGWHVHTNLNTTKALLTMIQQNTTLARMADVFLATFDYRQDIFDVAQDTLFEEMTQIVANCFGYVAGSRFSSVTLARNRNMITAMQQGVLNPSEISYEPEDWLDLQIQERRAGDTAQVILAGKLGDDTPIRAVYPVSGPAHNGAIVTLTGFLFKSQIQANEMALLLYRRDNTSYKGVSLNLANYRIGEPAFQSYFSIYLPEQYNNRGINWVTEIQGKAGRGFYMSGMNILYEKGFIRVNLEGRISRFGISGEDWQPANPVPTLEQMYGYDQHLMP